MSFDDPEDVDLHAVAEELGLLDLLEDDDDEEEGESSTKKKKVTICQRCHHLQHYGKIEHNDLRPGWSNEPQISQEKFRTLLKPLREKTCVIIALIDLFDFTGSVLPELDDIANANGENPNPVIVAANKADLLPSTMGPVRVENWIRRELEYLQIKSLASIGGAVRLISCKTGQGVYALLEKAKTLAAELDCDIYVVGAANAGKSTLLNHILRQKRDSNNNFGGNNNNKNKKNKKKIRAGNNQEQQQRNANDDDSGGYVTTSSLPGTTLRFIQVDLGNGQYLYDTPGLLIPGALTQLLTPEELKIVVPKK